jgi:hypothetical protein
VDTKSEDTIVRQIEKNLSNNINENLFLSGRLIENSKTPAKSNGALEAVRESKDTGNDNPDYPLVSYDHITNTPTLSRAEYIRQAREACLRQLSNTQVYSRPYDVNYMDTEARDSEQLNKKKAKVMKLFHNEAEEEEASALEENTPQELASYRSLIIRSVCAIVLFLSIFLIDKFDIKIGNLTQKMIQDYVTGNDTLKQLEDILVTWLK